MRLVPYNHHDDATVTLASGPGPDEEDAPLTNTQNAIRGEVWRNTDTDAIQILGTFADGLARPIDHFSLWRHRILGATVRLRLYSAVAQGGSTLYDSGAVSTLWWPLPSGGYDWGGSRGYDPHAREKPYVSWLPQTYAAKSYSIDLGNFAGTAAYWSGLTDAWHISRIFLGCAMEPITGPAFGATFGFAQGTTSNSLRSYGGSLRTSQGAQWDTVTLDLNAVRESEAQFWRDFAKQTGFSKDFVISLYPEEATIEERDHTWLFKMSALDALNRQARVLTRRLQLEEV